MDVKGKVGQLKQLRYLKDEVETLSHRIARLEWRIERNSQCRWRGRSSEEFGARLVALRKRLVFRRACCMEQLEALYAFIDQIGDSRMRQIMAARYIDGLTWKGVAAHIGERDEQYPRRLHNRFLRDCALPEALTGTREAQGNARNIERGSEREKANG
ncbi:MAG: hypothetical protein IKE17_00570 [Clostridia bacterium]|nr:hypothetical protein [Clostridia bacterium]